MGFALITIQDSGKRRTADASPNELDAISLQGSNTTAQAGSVLTLNSVQVTYSLKANLKKDAILGAYRTQSGDTGLQPQQRQYTGPELDQGSINAPQWTIVGTLDLTKTTGANSLITFGQLCRMAKTKGYLILAGHDMVLYSRYEESNNATISGVNVRLESADMVYVPDTKLQRVTYTLVFVETA